MKWSEARAIDYDMMAPFIVQTLLDEYAPEAEDCWANRSDTGVNLFNNRPKISLQ